ncbi:alpha/beta-hydrolase [Thozetella sp. PMI_491]|nr:alpha/beta-hydrolase [Thozetella sp. PMI_491]
MKSSTISLFLGSLGLGGVAIASAFPPEPTGLTTVVSKNWPGATIEYKQTSVCETTPGVKAWSGYISLPGSLLNKLENVHGAIDANMFFWYFQSRNDSASSPTAIYLGGGPGYTSLDPTSGFPCNINADSNSTTPNPFSWNNHVNMLYVEQPVGTGFSYQTRVNGTLNLLTNEFSPLSSTASPKTNETVLAATLDPRDLSTTVNSTLQAGRIMWQFSQIFFQEFPEHKTSKPEISLWGNSYGGYWGANFFDLFLAQNQLVQTKSHKNPNATVIPLGTLGIGNGCIDARAQALGWPLIANNNTYGIKSYSDTVYQEVIGNITMPETGCYALIDKCRALVAEGDPTGQMTNATVNAACQAADAVCVNGILAQFAISTNRSNFDITQLPIRSDVDNYFNGFYNQRWVQEDLGARINFTENNLIMQAAMFALTGDAVIRDLTPLERLVRAGVNLALVYGDRDYQCNWIGAENISLVMDYPEAPAFRSAGYADIVTNSSYNGGLVRQHGNVSFSRVFEAGHAFTASQPETVYQIFQRSMFGLDVATGKVEIDQSYSTEGPSDVMSVTNKVGESLENVCYTWIPGDTCSPDQIQALSDGTAVVKDFVVVEPRGWLLASDGSVALATSATDSGSSPSPSATVLSSGLLA